MGPMLWISLGVVGILVIWLIAAYNRLVSGRNEVRNAWSQIDVQLKRRHDLIPNLVETVKGYATHEKETLDRVITARSRAVGAHGPAQAAAAEGELSQALGRLMVVAEQYPDLKANQNFAGLQEELTSTENKIGFARQFYNDSVMTYNTRLESFPTNTVGGMFGFEKEEFFELTDTAQRETPRVSFS
ncbi:MAG TPA: LemA family protein [Phycisphaerae bacterium]|nr:LemA family protein [Phycisphaerae bacterium]